MRRFVLWAGLFGTVPSLPVIAQHAPQSAHPHDSRLVRLQAFLEGVRSPIDRLAADFLAAADRYELDWRLLPSIALVESGAGKHCLGNNIFGWKSGQKRFASVREAIYTVASRLALSPLYRGKGLNQILATYNPRPEYAARVKAVMRQVAPGQTAALEWPTPSAELQTPARPE